MTPDMTPFDEVNLAILIGFLIYLSAFLLPGIKTT
jgi:hypothetical protein